MSSVGSPVGRRILRIERRHCPHCSRNVSLKTFKMHKRLYYDAECDKWVVSGGYRDSSSESEPECDRIQFHSSPEPMQDESESPVTMCITILHVYGCGTEGFSLSACCGRDNKQVCRCNSRLPLIYAFCR